MYRDQVWYATGYDFVRVFHTFLPHITTEYAQDMTDFEKEIYGQFEFNEPACWYKVGWTSRTTEVLWDENALAFHLMSHGLVCAALCLVATQGTANCPEFSSVNVSLHRERHFWGT